LESELHRQQHNYSNLSEMIVSQKAKARMLEDQKLEFERQAITAKELRDQQLSTLEAKLLKHEAKLQQNETKGFSRAYGELLHRMLGRTLESTAQLRQLSKQELSK